MGHAQVLLTGDSDRPRPPSLSHGLLARIRAFEEARDARSRYHSVCNLIKWIQRLDRYRGRHAELQDLVEYLESDAEARRRFRASFGCLLQEVHSLTLLAESGIPSDQGLGAEVVQRVVARFLPLARRETDSSKLLINLYSSREAVQQFREISPELFGRLVSVLAPHDDETFFARQHEDLCEALRLLATRVSWLGLRPEMRERSVAAGISDSPFYELTARTEELLKPDAEEAPGAISIWQEAVGRIRQEMGAVTRHMETAGASVALVFDLKKIGACLARMEVLVATLHAATPADSVRATRTLLEILMQGRQSDRSLTALVRENLDLVARKTVERTGRSGEHYIAHDRADYWHMWRAAIGGGLITVFTAAIKMRIVDAHLPPFVEGLASGTNYAVSFLVLQMLGLVLATKQPAATAATFAGIVRDNRGIERSSKIADFVSHITSTQLAAALGNVLAVGAGAVVFDWLWMAVFQNSFLVEKSSEHVYEMLHPWHSPTAFYAIVTGIILWMAALAGGWCENFATYYRISEAVAEHPLGARIGEDRTAQFAKSLDTNLGGWSTSVVLGYLLGFTPVIGSFFGVPLDVRHVTLSSGTLALAATGFGAQTMRQPEFYYAVAGIGLIFVLNLFVSFTIAGIVALRAYDVGMAEQISILRYLVISGLRTPLRFILPAKDTHVPAATSADSP